MRKCSILAFVAALAFAACGDDMPSFGTRGDCGAGGAINDCPDPELMPYAVCEKMVACGVIVRDSHGNGGDYGSCVNTIFQRGDDGTQSFLMACIAASSCDELASGYCFAFGEN